MISTRTKVIIIELFANGVEGLILLAYALGIQIVSLKLVLVCSYFIGGPLMAMIWLKFVDGKEEMRIHEQHTRD